MSAGVKFEQVSPEAWQASRDREPEDSQHPCDAHPAESCFCAGACSCHWQQPAVLGACLNASNHTNGPDDYMAWHDWAPEKSNTHKQERCPGCGLWKIWRPR